MRPRSLVILFCIAFFLGLSFSFLFQSSVFTIDKVEVNLLVTDSKSFGLQPYFSLTQPIEEVVKKMKQWEGKKLWQIPSFSLPEPLSSLDWLEYAKVYRLWPQNLKVELKPKKVQALYFLKKDLRKHVFSDGSLSKSFSTSQSSQSSPAEKRRLKTLFGSSLGLLTKEAQNLRKKALELLECLEVLEQENSHKFLTEIKQIHFTEVHGFTLERKIHLGLQDFSPKLRKLAKVLHYLEERSLQWRVIDADLSHKILVSTRKIL